MGDIYRQYNGGDLFEFTQDLEKPDIAHVDCPSNFELPHNTEVVDFYQQPNPRSLNQRQDLPISAGQQFVADSQKFADSPPDNDILSDLLEGLTDKELQVNLNPGSFQFNPNSPKCSSQEDPFDLHGNDIEYVDINDSPGTSSQSNEYTELTEDHASSLAPKIHPDEYDNSQIVINNQENVPTTSVQDPATGAFYEVTNTELSTFLHKKGKKQVEEPKMSQREIDQLVRRFCIPREMNFVNKDDARRLVNSNFPIKRVEKKAMKRTAETKKLLDQFACLLCPITQNHQRKFARKEDLKRHYHQHLSFVRFHCNICDYKISRVDHMKTHMATCHNGSRNFTKYD